METITSEDGRYVIHYHADCTGMAQIEEWHGFAPRLLHSRTSVPFELLATLMDNLLFTTPAAEGIATDADLLEQPTVGFTVRDTRTTNLFS